MSQKITSKNLTFERSIPPFLAALQGQVSGSSSPDPILSGRRRAVKPRSDSAEAEDAPLVLDDDGNVVSGVKIGLDGAVTETSEGAASGDKASGKEEGKAGVGVLQTETEKVAGIGASKKRKAGKVIGAEANEEAAEADRKKNIKSKVASEFADGEKPVVKGKKKAKKIKLSFGDGDGD